MIKRRRFHRPLGERRYKKLITIAVEGTKTEPQYFSMFNHPESIVSVKCLRSTKDTGPAHVLARMTEHLKQQSLRKTDHAWLVIDKDNWPEEQLRILHRWSKQHPNYGLALSNPHFEYWLLLHFEEGNGVTTSQQCIHRLKKHLPDYEKGIDLRKFSPERVNLAIGRAKQKDTPPTSDWPQSTGTTVYRLMEKIIEG